MSSVEDLVQYAKKGGDMSELWERIRRLIYGWCMRYQSIAAKQYLDMDDLMNTAYFGMLQAIQAFDPLRGFKFTTLLQYYVRNSVRKLLGLQGKKRLSAVSLDTPLSDTEDITLLDTVEDCSASEPFERAEKSVVHSFVWHEVDKLTEKQRAVIYGVFLRGGTLAAIGRKMQCSAERVRQLERDALRKLRKNENIQQYRAEEYAYNYRGVQTFQRTGTSSTEWAVLKAEEQAKMLKK